MKPSFYNLVAKDDEGYLIYNALWKNIVRLDEDEFYLFQNGASDKLKSDLYELNIFVDDDFDEYEYYKLQWYRSLFSSGILRHTILPNLSCNCDCPYCFETKNGSFMSTETADNYLRWLEPQLQDAKFFYVSWFGGEPLLSKGLIEYLSLKIIKLCQQNNVEYSSCIVTNGVLLDKSFVDKMESLHIENVQITLDGERNAHNQIRSIKGKGTFDEILKNLVYYCKATKSDTASILRVNLSDCNYETIPELLNEIPDSIRERCVLIFQWVYSHSYGRNPGVFFSREKMGVAPYENISNLYKLALQKGYNINSFDEGMNCNFCECDFDHAYQIDQDGDIFLCTHSMDKKEVIGNVTEGITTQRNLSRLSRFITANPFDDEECKKCKILPICNGGCRKARYLGEKACSKVKYSVETFVLEKAFKASLNSCGLSVLPLTGLKM